MHTLATLPWLWANRIPYDPRNETAPFFRNCAVTAVPEVRALSTATAPWHSYSPATFGVYRDVRELVEWPLILSWSSAVMVIATGVLAVIVWVAPLTWRAERRGTTATPAASRTATLARRSVVWAVTVPVVTFVVLSTPAPSRSDNRWLPIPTVPLVFVVVASTVSRATGSPLIPFTNSFQAAAVTRNPVRRVTMERAIFGDRLSG